MSIFDFLQPRVDVRLNVPLDKTIDIDSEIDWKIIDQLHNAVLIFSRNSMQAKKIMFTLLGVFVAAIVNAPTLFYITKWFPVILGIVVLFWAFDAHTYYYQEKLRAAMNDRFEALKRRYPGTEIRVEYTLPEYRKTGCRIWRSFFNVSVFFYPAIIFVLALCWLLIDRGVIV